MGAEATWVLAAERNGNHHIGGRVKKGHNDGTFYVRTTIIMTIVMIITATTTVIMIITIMIL